MIAKGRFFWIAKGRFFWIAKGRFFCNQNSTQTIDF